MSLKGMFATVYQRVRECGTFWRRATNSSATKHISMPQAEKNVLDSVSEQPGTSTCKFSRLLRFPHSPVWRTIHEHLITTTSVMSINLNVKDYLSPLHFCRWFLIQCNDPQFHSCVLLTDEAKFTRKGTSIFNSNFYIIIESRHQQMFLVINW